MVKEEKEDSSLFDELMAKNILVSTDKNYLILFKNISISMYGARAWAFTLQQIALKKGEKYIFDLGYLMGKDSAEEVNETFKKLGVFLSKEIKKITSIIEATGFGITEITSYIPKKRVELKIIKNPILEFGKELYGEKSDICLFYAGVYSGFISNFLDLKDCKLAIKECISKGDKNCSFYYEK
ncbi:hypothetical protein HZA33_04500 [Candidatus Pacearchaeota archaeon]|nr:hypothetical protein [Candidatus Pacearchaeota archaeon]